jgi:hypothetical protein
MRSILWLHEITTDHRPEVGAKAFNLARMARAGIAVPAAYCLVTSAFEEFLVANDLVASARDLLATRDGELEPTASRLQDAIRRGRLTPALRADILNAYLALGSGGQEAPIRVAVRSSAAAEDLPGASFAGQFATRLNVSGEQELLSAIMECWASLWSPRAVSYRARQGVTQSPGMAVLVQSMVEAESSGVAFSVDPGGGAKQVVIEAAFGLGETVVGGEGDMDCYVVSRETFSEVECPVLGHKLRRRLLAAGGGVQVADVPPDMQDARVLTPQQVCQVAQTVLALERLLGCRQDMEWAWAEGHLFVLQARPITATAASFFTDVLPGDRDVWTAGFLNERFPTPVSPLGWSLARELLEELAFRDPLRYLGVRDTELPRITRLYRGHPYVNLFVFQTLYKVFPASLLPEDAARYFPEGAADLRLQVPYPRSALSAIDAAPSRVRARRLVAMAQSPGLGSLCPAARAAHPGAAWTASFPARQRRQRSRDTDHHRQCPGVELRTAGHSSVEPHVDRPHVRRPDPPAAQARRARGSPEAERAAGERASQPLQGAR